MVVSGITAIRSWDVGAPCQERHPEQGKSYGNAHTATVERPDAERFQSYAMSKQ